MASLKDVAKKAGVGLGTASRVLNNNPSVSKETKELVLKAMEELNYTPNAIARSLKLNSTKTIGVIIPDITSEYYPEVVRGIEDMAKISEYNILLCNTDLCEEKEIKAIKMLLEKKVDGILFMSNTIGKELNYELKLIGVPTIFISTKDSEGTFINVNIDNELASFEGVNYLCSLGHKKIAMLAGVFKDPNSGVPRIKGYKKALLENNIEINEDYILEGDYTFKAGYLNMKKILSSNERPTAVFAASDTMALGAAKAILESGYKIPEDISLLGFDGIELGEYFYPPLTTISQPRYEMGKVGMQILEKIINKKDIDTKSIMMKHTLIKRGSCKRI